MILLAFILITLLSLYISKHVPDKELFDLVKDAEDNLKLFIYPIPSNIHKNEKIKYLDSKNFHFDHLFPQYLTQSFARKDSRHNMIVKDPNKANAFLIYHYWGPASFHNHLKPVITNIIQSYPYFNRSCGHDHFMISSWDHGPFCGIYRKTARTHLPEVNQFLSILANVSIIGNYGMNDGRTEDGNKCHRPGQDIVIPQYIDQSSIDTYHTYKKMNQYGLEHRMYDSIFSGVVWNVRIPLRTMAQTEAYDYLYNHTEHYLFSTAEPFHLPLYLPSTYYMYNPCGQACWSARLYDGMAYYLIPILINTGAIQAFERYFDWTLFTYKMNSNTFETPQLLIKYRQKLRIQVDLVRTILKEYIYELASTQGPVPSSRTLLSNYRLETTNTSSPSMVKLMNTSIYKKLSNINDVFKWFIYHDNDTIEHRANAYRLVTLEMWCRIAGLSGSGSGSGNRSIPEVCLKSTATVATLEYM